MQPRVRKMDDSRVVKEPFWLLVAFSCARFSSPAGPTADVSRLGEVKRVANRLDGRVGRLGMQILFLE